MMHSKNVLEGIVIVVALFPERLIAHIDCSPECIRSSASSVACRVLRLSVRVVGTSGVRERVI